MPNEPRTFVAIAEVTELLCKGFVVGTIAKLTGGFTFAFSDVIAQ